MLVRKTSVLCLAVAFATLPVNSAWAADASLAPPDAAPATEGAPADPNAAPAEGEPAEGEPAEGEPAEGEGEPAEGETTEGGPAEGEGEGEATEKPVEEPPPPPPEPEGPPPDPEPRIGKRAATGKGLLIGGSITLAGGIALLATSIAITRCEDERGAQACDEDTLLIPAAATMTAAGIAILATGLVYNSRYKKWQKRQGGAQAGLGAAGHGVHGFMVAPSFGSTSAGFAAVGRF